MHREKTKRIAINPDQQGLVGFMDALASLSLGPLPAGPDLTTPASDSGKKRGRVVLRRETAHRAGKIVVVVGDFPPTTSAEEIAALAKRLRRALGTGGTVRERTIEMQGDHPAKVCALLEAEGWQVAGVRA